MLGRQSVMYIHNLLVYSPTLEDHIAHIPVVLERLLAKTPVCQSGELPILSGGRLLSGLPDWPARSESGW
jgi:hypothetical protein